MKKTLLATVAAIAALTLQAGAQEPAYDWTGFYVGANAGYGWTDLDVSHDGDDFESSDDGFLGGLHVGRDWQRGGLVYGVVGDFDLVEQSIDEDLSGKFENYTYDVDWVATARVRAGFALDRTLLFASGGLAFSEIDVSARASFLGVPGTGRSSELDMGGVLGLGVEHAFIGNWSAKAEYVHYFFDDIAVDVPSGPAVFDPSFGTLKLGISYRF